MSKIDLIVLERRSREVEKAFASSNRQASFRRKYGEDPTPEAYRWLARVAVADEARRSARAAWQAGRTSYRAVQEADALFDEAAEEFRAIVGVRPIRTTDAPK